MQWNAVGLVAGAVRRRRRRADDHPGEKLPAFPSSRSPT